MKYIKTFSVLFLLVLLFSCTKLDETFGGELDRQDNSGITPGGLLQNAYNSITGSFQTGNFWHLQEHTSDEVIGPTRGPDWDDNGQWRALHAHTWNADHGIVGGAFTELLGAQFAASNVLQFSPSAQQSAEARFIRALSMFAVLDGWDQVPYRENLNDYKELPTTLKGTDAANFIITELNDVIADLPDSGPAYTANKNGAKALLMKLYLNKGVYANRTTPAFDNGDLNQVITLANDIIASAKYSITANKYFDNFAPNNDAVSTENIYTFFNDGGVNRGGNVRGAWYQVAHYNMNPGGWNGFATLSDFYDKFEATDERLGKNYTYPGALPNPGSRNDVGFFAGQQYNLTTDEALKDRKGNPLIFTREVSIRETGDNLEVTGIRVVKYPYDYSTSADQKNNDWALLRYADVLLMKAEALLRTGDAPGALAIINDIRAKRGATPLAAATLDNLLDERGRELYWEGWRRQDLIRFGKYLATWQEKPTDDPKNLLFPIPSNQLAVNPNLTQNPGY
jgi:hypothetical protein